MRKLRKALFIDRDGVIVREMQVDSYEKIHFIPHVIEALREIRRRTDYEFVMVSNQDGVGTPSFPLDDFLPVHEKIMEVLDGEDIVFDDVNIDYSLPEDGCPGRKPGTAMLQSYLDGDYDLKASFMIGDRATDMELARRLGCRGIWLHDGTEGGAGIALETSSWLEIARFLTGSDRPLEHRTATVERRTGETDISLKLDLDGGGHGCVVTGIGFFDHMLDQIVRHGRIGLEARLSGDLQVDEHHSVEDFALALGRAFALALGDKKGINRYGFDFLCMDEVNCRCAVDFSGRPCFTSGGRITRDYVGSFPTELVPHFFKSFCDEARCTLHISVSRGNAHHQVEAMFKAFARALRMAVKRDPSSNEVPSTKGVLE